MTRTQEPESGSLAETLKRPKPKERKPRRNGLCASGLRLGVLGRGGAVPALVKQHNVATFTRAAARGRGRGRGRPAAPQGAYNDPHPHPHPRPRPHPHPNGATPG